MIPQDNETELVPVLAKAMESIPGRFAYIPAINAVTRFQENVKAICDHVNQFIAKTDRNSAVFNSQVNNLLSY